MGCVLRAHPYSPVTRLLVHLPPHLLRSALPTCLPTFTAARAPCATRACCRFTCHAPGSCHRAAHFAQRSAHHAGRCAVLVLHIFGYTGSGYIFLLCLFFFRIHCDCHTPPTTHLDHATPSPFTGYLSLLRSFALPWFTLLLSRNTACARFFSGSATLPDARWVRLHRMVRGCAACAALPLRTPSYAFLDSCYHRRFPCPTFSTTIILYDSTLRLLYTAAIHLRSSLFGVIPYDFISFLRRSYILHHSHFPYHRYGRFYVYRGCYLPAITCHCYSSFIIDPLGCSASPRFYTVSPHTLPVHVLHTCSFIPWFAHFTFGSIPTTPLFCIALI